MINKEHLNDIAQDRGMLLSGEGFAYLQPCERLRRFISNFTITFPNELLISNQYTILPHGSVTLVLFTYHEELHSFLFGPSTKPQHVGNLANKCDVIFIIEFQPAGFFPFTQLHQNLLVDKILPFSSVAREVAIAFHNIMQQAISIDELLNGIEKELVKEMKYPYPEELAQAIENIIQMEGILRSDTVSDSVSYSTRQLNRLFNRYLGMSMKAFSRLVRINRSIRLLNEENTTLASLCEALEYYDVSHFIKDFKTICNITPYEYKKNMSDFYNEVAKY